MKIIRFLGHAFPSERFIKSSCNPWYWGGEIQGFNVEVYIVDAEKMEKCFGENESEAAKELHQKFLDQFNKP